MTSAGGDRLDEWSLRRRLVVLFSFVVAALIASVAFSTAGVVHLNDSVHTQIDRIDPAQVAAVDFLNAMVNQETGVRGYVITRNQAFLQPFTSGEEEELDDYATLRRLLSGQAVLSADLSNLLRAAQAWQRGSADRAIIETAAGSPKARSVATTALGKRQFDAIRLDSGALMAELARRHAEADGAIGSADTTLVVLLVLGLLLLMLAIEGTLLALGRWVTRPIFQMAEEVRIVSGGDLSHAIEVAGPPELRLLATDVDSMRRRILADLATVEEARRMLDEQAERLRASNADLEQFAYVASHDLQEPLRKISSFSELVTRRYESQLDERGREYLGFMADGARRMQALINDVLELSRVGRNASTLSAVDCAEAAHSAVSNLAEEVEETGATVIVRELPVVRGDKALLVALFQNLIGNSLKFHGDEAPHVVIEAAPFRSAGPREAEAAGAAGWAGVTGPDGAAEVAQVAETAGEAEATEAAYWRFVVKDNGIGIAAEYRERVFAMFQRLHRREEYGGTGIGLALCRRIVEHHGGRIWLEESAGPGTAVAFTIPRASVSLEPVR
jgi:signal transduction histidine kinase